MNNPFEGKFYLKLKEKVEKKKSYKNSNKNSKGLNFPKANKVYKDQFSTYDFDENDALLIEKDQENKLHFNLNFDNNHLLNYCKNVKDEEIDAVKYQYEVSMVLVGIMVSKQYEKESERKKINGDSGEEVSLNSYSKNVTRSIAPILIPMVREIGSMFN